MFEDFRKHVVGEGFVGGKGDGLLGFLRGGVKLVFLEQAEGEDGVGMRICGSSTRRLLQLGDGQIVALLMIEQERALEVRGHSILSF